VTTAEPKGLLTRLLTGSEWGELVIVFNQRSLVAFLWVGELVRTEGWRAYRG
jgi:hypothetical protein